MKPEDWQKVENYVPSEWRTNPDKAPKELVFPMDQLRTVADCKIFILECFATSGHSDYSYHYIALAVDFYFEPGVYSPLQEFLLISQFPQFRGIGFYPDKHPYWHVDIRNSVPRVLWYRDHQNKYHYNPIDFLEVLCQNS